jgi:hypothetical protein
MGRGGDPGRGNSFQAYPTGREGRDLGPRPSRKQELFRSALGSRKRTQAMINTCYEVRSGKRPVSTQWASTAREALIEYLRSLGSRDDEIVSVAPDAVVWRGARYRAVPTLGDAA